MSLPFSFIPQEPVDVPPPVLNGGLYTGEPFAKDAPWANVPIIPDAGYMTNVALRSANPPLAALTQYPGNNRPGNNTQSMPGVQVVDDKYGLLCNKPTSDYKEKVQNFNDFFYI
jgi:hypothetical protein